MNRIFRIWSRQNRVVPGSDEVLASFPRQELKSTFTWILAIGLMSAAILDLLRSNLQINLFVILVLAASTHFPHFPSGSIRTQLLIALCTLGSFGWDFFVLIRRISLGKGMSRATVITIRVFAALMMTSKAVVFYDFLRHVDGAQRVRKYLHRRFRLFLFPFEQPKRIMRDVRGRYLALAWIHVVSLVMFVTLWVVLVYVLDYNIFFLDSFSSQYLAWFLAGKAATTLACIFGLWYDIDVYLCLLHFGCCAFTMPAIRRYIRQRRAVLGGYPLAVSFYPLRFFLWQLLKGVDLMVGVGLWVIVGLSASSRRDTEASMYAFLASLGFVLCVSDIWSILIIVGIRWLLSRYKMLQKLPVSLRAAIPSAQASFYSDDSELDEFNLRCPVPIAVDKGHHHRQQSSSSSSQKAKRQRLSSDRSVVANLKRDPIAFSSLMTAFLFPGKYLQEDGDVHSDSGGSDDSDAVRDDDDGGGGHSDEDADWDEQSKLIARRIEDKVQSTWSKFSQALKRYGKGAQPTASMPRVKKPRHRKRRVAIDPFALDHVEDQRDVDDATDDRFDASTIASGVDLTDVDVATLRKKPVATPSPMRRSDATDGGSHCHDDDDEAKLVDGAFDGDVSVLTDDAAASLVSARSTPSRATTKPSTATAAAAERLPLVKWISSPFRAAMAAKPSRVLPTLIPDRRHDDHVPGWEDDDGGGGGGGGGGAGDLDVSLQDEDERLGTTRRRQKAARSDSDDSGSGGVAVDRSFEEFDVLDQRLDGGGGELHDAYARPKPDGGSTSKFDGANPMHRWRGSSATKRTRVTVNVADLMPRRGDASSSSDSGSGGGGSGRRRVAKTLRFDGDDGDDRPARTAPATTKGYRVSQRTQRVQRVAAMQTRVQQRLLCPTVDVWRQRWQHWRYRWLTACPVPLRAQRVQFAWPIEAAQPTTRAVASVPTRKATHFDTAEEEAATRLATHQRLTALRDSVCHLLQRHPLRFQLWDDAPAAAATASLDLSPRKILAQTLLVDDSGRLGVWIDDDRDDGDAGDAATPSRSKKSSWLSALTSGASAAAGGRGGAGSGGGGDGASYVLVLWEFTVASVGAKQTPTTATAADHVVHVATDFVVEIHLAIDPSLLLEATPEQRRLWRGYEEFLFRSFHWDTLPRYASVSAPTAAAAADDVAVSWATFHVVALDYAVLNATAATATVRPRRAGAPPKSNDGGGAAGPALSSTELAQAALFG